MSLPHRHNSADLGTFDEAVEDHHQGFLIFVRELIDLAVQAVQFGVVDARLGVGFLPPGQRAEQAAHLFAALAAEVVEDEDG